jgi:hypothetical protein
MTVQSGDLQPCRGFPIGDHLAAIASCAPNELGNGTSVALRIDCLTIIDGNGPDIVSADWRVAFFNKNDASPFHKDYGHGDWVTAYVVTRGRADGTILISPVTPD